MPQEGGKGAEVGVLQLRALFVIAMFILMPDSSYVYLADGERVEMPMI